MIEDEGIINGLKIIFRYMINSKTRKRMTTLSNFFKVNPEHVGYGIFIGVK